MEVSFSRFFKFYESQNLAEIVFEILLFVKSDFFGSMSLMLKGSFGVKTEWN